MNRIKPERDKITIYCNSVNIYTASRARREEWVHKVDGMEKRKKEQKETEIMEREKYRWRI